MLISLKTNALSVIRCTEYPNSSLQHCWSEIWTITHEEIFREVREYCDKRSKTCKKLIQRKIFYVFTCEYCLSHWISLVFVLVTGYRLLLADWRGLFLAVFALVWVSNLYMSLYGRLR